MDAKELHKRFIYFPETGLLLRRKDNVPVGSFGNDGYLTITIDKVVYKVHDIVFCIYHGYWPKQIDHINRLPYDNRICNLREVSRTENQINRHQNSNNKTGVTGVRRDNKNNRWIATIGYDRKSVHIGSFKYFVNAVKARRYAEKKLNFDLFNETSSAEKYLNNYQNLTEVTSEKAQEVQILIKNEWSFFCNTRKVKLDIIYFN